MRVRVPIGDRVLVLDSDIGVGENWKEASAWSASTWVSWSWASCSVWPCSPWSS